MRIRDPQRPAPATVSEPTPPEGHAARCVSPDHAAEVLGLDVSKVYHLLRARRLPGFKEGKYWLIPLAALEAHVRKRLDTSLFHRHSKNS
jgi:excisionase family DNA binding protein